MAAAGAVALAGPVMAPEEFLEEEEEEEDDDEEEEDLMEADPTGTDNEMDLDPDIDEPAANNGNANDAFTNNNNLG